jgi:hypothetical protein
MALRRVLPAVLVGLLVGGCATRGVASGPTTEPGVATWVVIGVAASAAAAVLGLLLVHSDRRRGGVPLVAALLALQAGGVVVGASVLVGLAVRSGQLAGRPADAELASSLVRVSRLDGDGSLALLIVLLVVVLAGLTTLLLGLAARFAAGTDRVERWTVVGVLGAELLATAYAVARVASGDRAVVWMVVALQLPLVVAALVAGWPARAASSAQPTG